MQLPRTILTVALILWLLLVPFTTGCSDCLWKPGAKEYREIAGLISSNNTDAGRRFSELTVDQQVTVLLYARNCRDDPRIRDFFLVDGETKISGLLERIKTENDLRDKVDLLHTLIGINTRCKCIERESEVIQELRAVGKQIKLREDQTADHTYLDMYGDSVEELNNQLVEDGKSRQNR